MAEATVVKLNLHLPAAVQVLKSVTRGHTEGKRRMSVGVFMEG